MSIQNRAPSKLLGDAGEHYALSQLSFSGKFAAKMPDIGRFMRWTKKASALSSTPTP